MPPLPSHPSDASPCKTSQQLRGMSVTALTPLALTMWNLPPLHTFLHKPTRTNSCPTLGSHLEVLAAHQAHVHVDVRQRHRAALLKVKVQVLLMSRARSKEGEGRASQHRGEERPKCPSNLSASDSVGSGTAFRRAPSSFTLTQVLQLATSPSTTTVSRCLVRTLIQVINLVSLAATAPQSSPQHMCHTLPPADLIPCNQCVPYVVLCHTRCPLHPIMRCSTAPFSLQSGSMHIPCNEKQCACRWVILHPCRMLLSPPCATPTWREMVSR